MMYAESHVINYTWMITALQDFPSDSVAHIPLINRETRMFDLRAEYESQGCPQAFLEQIDWLISNGCDYVRRTKGTWKFLKC